MGFLGLEQGAAVAQLTALKLARDWAGDERKPVSFIGFGTPRVGNAAWKALFESLVTRGLRVKNSADPVCGVAAWPYVHAGEEKHIGKPDAHPDLPLVTNMADHDAGTYVEHCTHDDPIAGGGAGSGVHYLLMFAAGKLAGAAHRWGK